jgi:hypothetical protein
MKKTVIVFSLSVLCLFTACHKKDKRLNAIDKDLNAVLSRNEISSANFCIIVPRTGCGGCIDNATTYVKINLPRLSHTEAIFTGIIDKKQLSLEVGDDFLKKQNVHLDTNNVFRDLEIQSIYPQVIKIQNGNSVAIKELDVNSNDMNELLKM